MNAIIDTIIYCKNPKHVHAILRKEFQTDISIFPGMYIEDQAWPDGEVEIARVSINPCESYLMIDIADKLVEFPNKDECEKRVKQLRSSGWKSPNEWK